MTTKQALTPVDKLFLSQSIDRYCMANLTPMEYMLFRYVFDRSLMWGRSEQRITRREFANGNALNCGLSLSRNSIDRTIQALVHRGALTASGSRRAGMTYSLNFDWIEDQKMLKTSKKSGAGPLHVEPSEAEKFFSEDHYPHTGGTDTPDRGNSTPTQGEASKESTFQENTSKDQSAPMARVVSFMEKASAVSEARGARKRVRLQDVFNVDALQNIWLDAMTEHHRSIPRMTWSPRGRGLITTHYKAGLFREVDVAAFTEWTVENWHLIMGSVFGWMKDRPAQPVFDFVAVQCHRFVAAYIDREQLIAEATLTGDDRLRAIMRRQGLSPEQINHRLAVAEERKSQKGRRQLETQASVQMERTYERARAPGGTVVDTIHVSSKMATIRSLAELSFEEQEEEQ